MIPPDPIDRFREVYARAEKIDRSIIPDPNAMSLGTIENGNQPSVRIVLLKAFDERKLSERDVMIKEVPISSPHISHIGSHGDQAATRSQTSVGFLKGLREMWLGGQVLKEIAGKHQIKAV